MKLSFLNLTDLRRTSFRFIQQYTRWISVGVSVLLIGIMYLLVLGPKLASIQDRGLLDLERSRTELTQQESQLTQLQELEREYAQVTLADRVKLERIIPADPGIPELFLHMQELFSTAGFTMSQVAFSFAGTDSSSAQAIVGAADADATAPSLPEDIRVIKITTTVAGPRGYQSFKNLLETIERNERIINLTNFTYADDVEVYNLSLETFYREVES